MVTAARFARVALLLVALTAIAGCRPSPPDVTALQLQNDLGVGVRTAPCNDSACHSLAGTVRYTLSPGDVLPVNVSTEGVATYYRVEAASGPRRCLRLVAHGEPRESTVLLSSAGVCTASSQGGTSLAGAILGWGLFVGIAALGLLMTAVGAAATYRHQRASGSSDHAAAAVATGVGFVLFIGGWIFYLVYWLIRRVQRRAEVPA